MTVTRARVRVRGLVQGVWFRAQAQTEAELLGVTGWVRNLPDGSVEAALEGEADAVERMLGWCRRGPPDAIVEKVDVVWERPAGDVGFQVRG